MHIGSHHTVQGDGASLRLGVPAHDLLLRGARRGSWDLSSLEGLRDELQVQKRSERAEERVVPLSDCRFEFPGAAEATVRFRGRSRFGRPVPITTHALSQLLRRLGPGSLSVVEHLVDAGGRSELRLAGRLVHGLIGERHGERRVRFRIVRRSPDLWGDEPGRARRVVVAAVGASYRPYDDVDFMSDVLDVVPEDLNLRVKTAWRSSEGLSVRMAVLEDEPDPHDPVPMVEFRNSEVGLGSASVTGMIFKLVCTNGAYGWGQGAAARWPHRGNTARVRDELVPAIRRLLANANASRSRYIDARTLAVGRDRHEVREWLEARRGRYRLTEAMTGRILDALDDPTTSRTAAGGYGLASVVDAITLQAQSTSFSGIYDDGRLASRLLDEELAAA
jgi:hypothetical protein